MGTGGGEKRPEMGYHAGTDRRGAPPPDHRREKRKDAVSAHDRGPRSLPRACPRRGLAPGPGPGPPLPEGGGEGDPEGVPGGVRPAGEGGPGGAGEEALRAG